MGIHNNNKDLEENFDNQYSKTSSRFYVYSKQVGVAIGHLCKKCDGRCAIFDSYVRPTTLVRICDECNYGSYQDRCVIYGGPGCSDAYYC